MAEPKVRFKRDDGSSYPAWNDVVLGDIATRVTRKNTNGETDRPLTISSIEGLIDQRTYFGKTIASKDMSGYFLLKNGEYAYNKSYSAGYDYGSIKRLDKYDMGALSTLYICFALNEDQNTDFYDCYFNGLSWYNQMPQICAEGARNHGLLNVSPNDFFKIQLSVPSSKEEQQKIADFLSSVDEVISTSEQEVANLETQKKAVMKKIFSQEVRFKRADGSDFPEWKEKDFKEEADYLSGLTYAPDDVVPNADDGVLVLRSSNIQGGVIDYNDNVFVKCKILDNLFVQENDILMCVRNGSKKLVGKTALIKKSDLGHTWGAFMMIIRSHTDNRFIYHYLNSDNFYKQMFPDVNTATIAQITKGMLNDCVVEMPCLEEQRLIANFLSDFDEAIAAAKKELELWKELKKGLLQQMFV